MWSIKQLMVHQWRRQSIVAVVATLAILVIPSDASRAEESLENAVSEIASKVTGYLKDTKQSAISIGSFTGPTTAAATSGPAIVRMLRERFEELKIAVVPRASVGLRGEYTLTKVPIDGSRGSGNVIAVKIKGSLVDQFEDVITDFSVKAHAEKLENVSKQLERIVAAPTDIATLLGATTSLHPQDSEEDRKRDLTKHVLNPRLHIEGTQASAASGSVYSIEVLVRNHPLAIQVENGLGFCSIARGDTYIVRVHNRSEYDAAVRLAIDGLNVFTFSEILNTNGKPKYQHYIIPAGAHADLKGWHKNNSQVSSFLITKYADSAAATINHLQDIGTINAQFFAAWEKGGPKPHDEQGTAKSGGDATGFGPPIKQVVKETKRQTGRLRASISLRYAR